MKAARRSMHPLVFAVAVALAPAAAFAADLQDAGDAVSDARREATIWTTYAFNDNLKAFDIDVDVRGDVATLSGTVESGIEKDLAEQIALGADGIARVDNKLQIDPAVQPKPRTHVAGEQRRFDEVVGDASITAQVKSKLLWNAHTDGLHIDVDTVDGQVTLNGTADSAASRELAERLAENTAGVRQVHNKLTIGEPQPLAKTDGVDVVIDTQPVTDAWISTKVKSTLLMSRSIDGFAIDVDTTDGTVRLSGRVDSATEKEHAVALARDVKGVQRVDATGLEPALSITEASE